MIWYYVPTVLVGCPSNLHWQKRICILSQWWCSPPLQSTHQFSMCSPFFGCSSMNQATCPMTSLLNCRRLVIFDRYPTRELWHVVVDDQPSVSVVIAHVAAELPPCFILWTAAADGQDDLPRVIFIWIWTELPSVTELAIELFLVRDKVAKNIRLPDPIWIDQIRSFPCLPSVELIKRMTTSHVPPPGMGYVALRTASSLLFLLLSWRSAHT